MTPNNWIQLCFSGQLGEVGAEFVQCWGFGGTFRTATATSASASITSAGAGIGRGGGGGGGTGTSQAHFAGWLWLKGGLKEDGSKVGSWRKGARRVRP